jgi:5-methylcytosine-specific restriction endonuclease McrA
MKLVTPEERTTLLLNRHYQAFSFCSARAAIRHLITGRIKGMDADGNVASWDGSDIDSFQDVSNSLSWKDGTVKLFDLHPYLRSAPNVVTGEETRNFIPTIAICGHHFGFHARKGQTISLKSLYSIYKGICQYCLKHIPMSHATKDHVYPKSQGGSNDDFNLVLACRECNNAKDNIFPYHDVNGKEVKPKKFVCTRVPVPENDMRPEWKPFLFLE